MKQYLVKWTAEPVKKDWYPCEVKGMDIIEANSLADVKQDFISYMNKTYGYEFSKHAVRNPQRMYMDIKAATVQAGIIYTVRTEVDFDYDGCKKRYLRLWTEIYEMKNVYSNKMF